MSFSFYAAGSPAAVKKECDRRYDHESAHSVAVKNLVKELLAGAPAGSIVVVESGGHHDYGNTNYSSGTVDFKFRLTRPLPEPPEETTTVA